MTKHDILTENEITGYELNRDLLRHIENYVKKTGLKTREINILDWGCGRGRAVARLRELGYNAFGVDIDPLPLKNGRPLFAARGLDAESVLREFKDQGKTDFPDGYFNFIFSQQVLEHVRDIKSVAGEMARITAPDGEGLHFYPAHRHIVESHLFMPFIHWLPKNILRKYAITFFLFVGEDPGWENMKGKSVGEKALTYYDYSINFTFYRNWRAVRLAFRGCGFAGKFVTLENPHSIILRKFGGLLKNKLLYGIAYGAHLCFSPVLELLAVKVSEKEKII